MNLFALTGKTCLVTGASSGIGREASRLIASSEGRVIATGRDEKRLQETRKSLAGDNHLAVPADLLEEEDRNRLVADCPQLDGIVHSAGIARMAPLRFTNDKVLRDHLSINLETPIHLTRELVAAGKLNDGGAIVFLSSYSAVHASSVHLAYSASKAALLAVTRSLACELAPRKIRCNALCPAMVRTRMIGTGLTAEQLEADEKRYPFGYGEPEDVAAAIVFFLSPGSRWISGQTLVLDGGCTLR